MQHLPTNFDVQIEDLFPLVPETTFSLDEIHLFNYFNFQVSDHKAVLFTAFDAAKNNDIYKLKQISFFTEEYIPQIIALSEKINNQNIQDFLQIAIYAFNTHVTVELDDNLEPINKDNVLKIQAVEIGAVPHHACNIIIPHDVEHAQVYAKFPTAKPQLLLEPYNVLKYYMDNTSIKSLLNINENQVEKTPTYTQLFPIFDINPNNKEEVAEFFETFSKITPIQVENENAKELIKHLPDSNLKKEDVTNYFGNTIAFNKKMLGEIYTLNEQLLNDPEIAAAINLCLSKIQTNLNLDLDIFFNNSPFAKSLTSKLFLDNIRNSPIFFKTSSKEDSALTFIIDELTSAQKSNLNLLSSTIVEVDYEHLPTYQIDVKLLAKQDDITKNKINYLRKVVETPNIEKLQGISVTLLAIYPFLSLEQKSSATLVTTLNSFAYQIYPKQGYGGNAESIAATKNMIDHFINHIPLNTFKETYQSLYKNHLYPKRTLACLLEIEAVLLELLDDNRQEYSTRNFQTATVWKDFFKLNFGQIFNDLKHSHPIIEKHLPILHKLAQAKSHKPFFFFFNKFVNDYFPSQNTSFNNKIFEMFCHHISTVYEEHFKKENVSITPQNAIIFEKTFQGNSDVFKQQIIKLMGDLEWNPDNDEHQTLFKELCSKLGKKSVISLSHNPNTHHFFKHPTTLGWLRGRSIFTNGINDKNELPLQHIFSIQDVKELYEKYPDKEFVKVSPFTFIVLAPMQHKTDPQLWIDLITDKAKTSILNFLPVSIKNNPDVLLKMLRITPNKSQAFLSHFSDSAVNNISVFFQALENATNNHNIQNYIFQKYKNIILSAKPEATTFKDIDVQEIRILCEELLLNNVMPAAKATKTKSNKF